MAGASEAADVARYRENRQKEVDGAALYRALAAATTDPALAAVYRRLADAATALAQLEGRHRAAGGNALPRWRGTIGTMLGVGAALGVAMTMLAVSQASLDLYSQDCRRSAADLYVVTGSAS
jgi:hypothetical protein